MLPYIFAFILISSVLSSATYEKGGGGFIDQNIGQYIRDGVANGIERDTYFETNYYTTTKQIGAYYATWGVYAGRGYKPHQVPVERFTHIYVAFAGICDNNPTAQKGGAGLKAACNNLHSGSDNAPYYFPKIKTLNQGEVSFCDDKYGMFDTQFTDRQGNKYTQIEGIMKWKDRNQNLKIIWTVGGWSYSRPFFDMASTSQKRKLFIDSLINWLSEPMLGFIDGIGIDWQFPGGNGADKGVGDPSVDGANYISLIKEMRTALDTLGKRQSKRYMITTAIGVGPGQLDNWAKSGHKISQMMSSLDTLGLMTYDFAGAFSSNVGFVSALGCPQGTNMLTCVDKVMKSLKTQHGLNETDMKKISLGVAFYGRGQGVVDQSVSPGDLPCSPSKGNGGGGTVESGTFSYFDLYQNYIGKDGEGINGYTTYYYPDYGADLLYNPKKGQSIGYQSPRSVEKYAQYALDNGLKGVFAWEVDDDNGFLLESIHRKLSTPVDSPSPSAKRHIYAPNCQSMTGLTLKPGMVFSDLGRVYKLNGWVPKCPNNGESYEQQYWIDLGSIDDFVVYGASSDLNQEMEQTIK